MAFVQQCAICDNGEGAGAVFGAGERVGVGTSDFADRYVAEYQSAWGCGGDVEVVVGEAMVEVGVRHRLRRSDFVPQPAVETALFGFERRERGLISAGTHPTYTDFLAYVSKDRVGEGAWRDLFAKRQITAICDRSELIFGRGIKGQSVNGIVAAFEGYLRLPESKKRLTNGAMERLRTLQKQTQRHNRTDGHHQSRNYRRSRTRR